jgi:hypothetical protein
VERDTVTIGGAAIAAESLAALAGEGHDEAAQALRAMAEERLGVGKLAA